MGKTAWIGCGMALFCASAVDAAGAQAVGSANTVDSMDIVVTAQKRAQNLQDVAGSISAFGSQQLELTGSRSVADLTSQAPSLIFGQTNGGTFITLRGIGVSVDTGVAEPNVALHVDGVFIPRSTMATIESTDLERVEILRGPQGTLYGRNATGGAINFISQAPSRELTSGVNIAYGNYSTISTSAFLSGPLGENTRFRVSAGYDNRGEGYADNLFTGRDFDKLRRYSFRAALQSDLSDSFTVDLSAQYQKEHFNTYQQLIYPVGPGGLAQYPGLATAVAPSEPWTTGADFNPQSRRSTLMLRGGLNWAISDNVRLRSITAYLDHKFFNELDGDGTSLPIDNVVNRRQPSRSVSQEFNLSGNVDNRLDWILGAYFFHEKFSSSIPVSFPLGIPAIPIGPLTIVSDINEKTRSLAAFADATFSVTPRLRIYGGARLSNDLKRARQTSGILPGGAPIDAILGCRNLENRLEYTSFSPRVGAQYDVADDVMAYTQYQKGFKSGGLNGTTCGDIFEPEKLSAVEGGIKTRFFNRALTLNLSAFYYKYTDLQFFRFEVAGASIDNADARTYGLEFEANIRPVDIFSLDISGTFLDAKYTKIVAFDPAQPLLGDQDLRGNRPDRSPTYSVSLSPQLSLPLDMAGFDKFVLRGDLRFSGAYYFRAFNLEGDRQKAYQTVNVTAALLSDKGLTLRGYVRNLTNEAIVSHKFYNAQTDSWLGNYLPPRTYGIELGYRF